MTKPYDLFIRFLVTRGAEELEQVNNQLKELDLQPISEEYFDKHYDALQKILPPVILKQIENGKIGSGFERWMKVLEVWGLWQYQPKYRTKETAHLKLVYDIHTDIPLRYTINALLTKNISYPEIVQAINLKFSYMLREDHVEVYRKFFWDPARMARKDWKNYLLGCDTQEMDILFTALSEPVDVLKTSLELPSKINVSESLQFLFTTAYQKAKHYLKLSTHEANTEARAWIDQVTKLADKYEKHRVGDVDDFSKALQMEFDYISTDFPSPDEATMGNLRKELEAASEERREDKE